ncbi:carboxypeptidase regulatory-like domain-containing protein [candidate division WOR-3 bacterium]|nr:carboxypeptidase regulatory-like domain-containing protein [candidate division WOR-3 bacterium]
MSNSRGYLKIFMAALILAPFFVLAVEATGTIKGLVKDAETGEPVPSVAVEVFKDGKKLAEDYSNEDGYFILSDIYAGFYNIQCYKHGYETLYTKNILVSSDETTSLDLEFTHKVDISSCMVFVKLGGIPYFYYDRRVIFSDKDIQLMPVEDIDDLLRILPGIF